MLGESTSDRRIRSDGQAVPTVRLPADSKSGFEKFLLF
jgi:hypothetical protein